MNITDIMSDDEVKAKIDTFLEHYEFDRTCITTDGGKPYPASLICFEVENIEAFKIAYRNQLAIIIQQETAFHRVVERMVRDQHGSTYALRLTEDTKLGMKVDEAVAGIHRRILERNYGVRIQWPGTYALARIISDGFNLDKADKIKEILNSQIGVPGTSAYEWFNN